MESCRYDSSLGKCCHFNCASFRWPLWSVFIEWVWNRAVCSKTFAPVEDKNLRKESFFNRKTHSYYSGRFRVLKEEIPWSCYLSLGWQLSARIMWLLKIPSCFLPLPRTNFHANKVIKREKESLERTQHDLHREKASDCSVNRTYNLQNQLTEQFDAFPGLSNLTSLLQFSKWSLSLCE